MRRRTLLTIDAIINLLLGVLLVIFPKGVISALGIPTVERTFYPSILGAVLFGIGIALLLERFRERRHTRGLGLGGAISINLAGAIVLGAWLSFGRLSLLPRGYAVLWGLVSVLVMVSVCELVGQAREAQTIS